jgi:hypothetical protein
MPGQDHMGNWIDCVRSRKTPNASAEIGYRSAVAVHMANLAYRHKRPVTLEEANSKAEEGRHHETELSFRDRNYISMTARLERPSFLA